MILLLKATFLRSSIIAPSTFEEPQLKFPEASDPFNWPTQNVRFPFIYFGLKLFCCWCKFFALSHLDNAISLSFLGEILNGLLPLPWIEVQLAIESIIFEKARSKIQAFSCSETEREEALKANRKSASLPDLCKTLLEILFRPIHSFFHQVRIRLSSCLRSVFRNTSSSHCPSGAAEVPKANLRLHKDQAKQGERK